MRPTLTILNETIQPFVDYIKFEKRYSENTIRSYHEDLIDFFDFIDTTFGSHELKAITATFVRSWLADLKAKKISSKSINRKISCLKSFFKYQLRTGSLTQTPMTTIINPKISKRLPVYIEEKDIQTLLNTIEFPGDMQGCTDRLLINMFYNTGIRLSELINLRENQIDFSNRTIKVLGKGKKERIIPVSMLLIDQIKDYHDQKNKLDEADDSFLFVNKNGKKLYPKYVYLTVKKYLSKITTIDKKSPHVLRHTFATHLTNGGADLNSVKELLGHSSLAATQLYTHNSIAKLKDVYKKSHPKA
ncbi:MAG: tyrosine-type recombinase/integrase [Bacteroidetes bacterium]|nr:tyrosine-type recombinase/integrase [Bacteroidota bacterium]